MTMGNLFALILFLTFCTVSVVSKLELIDNGYRGLYIVIKETIEEDSRILDNLKKFFTEASHLLFQATKFRAFYHEVTIVVPKSWSSRPEYGLIPELGSLDEFVLVDKPAGHKDNEPYVKRGSKECGKKGLYIHLTPEFILRDSVTDYGPHDHILVNQWAKLRWGLFDEYQKDYGFYLYRKKWHPIGCTSLVTGNALHNCNPNAPCDVSNYRSVLPRTCRFCPHDSQDTTASIMAYPWIKSITSFCDKDSKETQELFRHNRKAPNDQNCFCKRKSAWEVMEMHEGFSNGANLPVSETTNTTPIFRYVQEGDKKRVFVLDVSGSMQGQRIEQQKLAAEYVIDNIIESGSWLGIVIFGSSASISSNLTQIISKADRETLKRSLPTNVLGTTSIGAGLLKGMEVLNKSEGSEIILITDGAENTPPYISDVKVSLVASGIVVHTIAVSQSADVNLSELAKLTNGKSYVFLESNTVSFADAMSQTILSSGPLSSLSTPVNIFSQTINLNATKEQQMFFYIDDGLGKDTSLCLIGNMNLVINVSVLSPIGAKLSQNIIGQKYSCMIFPDVAEIGQYSFTISAKTGSTVNVLVFSKPISAAKEVVRVSSWLSESSFNANSNQYISVYTDVQRGRSPVLNATVTAVMETSGDLRKTFSLHDNGAGADLIAGDGIYSAYILPAYVSGNGRSTIKISVIGERDAQTEKRSRADRSSQDQSATPTENFQRMSLPGEFTVSGYNPGSSTLVPPSRITDLQLTLLGFDQSNSNPVYALEWTAPGSNLDTGKVSEYDIRFSEDFDTLIVNFTSAPYLVNSSEVMPNDAGVKQKIIVAGLGDDETEGTTFIAIRARNEKGVYSEISNILTAGKATGFYVTTYEETKITEKDNKPATVIIIVATLAGIAVVAVAGVVLFIRIRSKRNGKGHGKENDTRVYGGSRF